MNKEEIVTKFKEAKKKAKIFPFRELKSRVDESVKFIEDTRKDIMKFFDIPEDYPRDVKGNKVYNSLNFLENELNDMYRCISNCEVATIYARRGSYNY